MQRDVVLALMQLKGISRKTIISHISVSIDCDYTAKGIDSLLAEARQKSPRIKQYSLDEISAAIKAAEKIKNNCQKLDIKIVSFLDEDYPRLFKECSDPPAVIYYKGDISYINEMDSVAIIGTREPSDYGKRIAIKLGESFAKRGFVDVSGLAIGCDAGGHQGCLNAGGKTIAIMAGGLDKIYPQENKKLAEDIVKKGGALMSEYPPYSNPYKGAFVDRDRLQSALSCGVMVIETREQGGTLHAVRYAGDYGRLVGCFKHPEKLSNIEQAGGNKMLVRDGKAVFVGNDADLDDYCNKLHEKGCGLKCKGE